MVCQREFFVFSELYLSLNALILKIFYIQDIDETSENASSRKLENRNWVFPTTSSYSNGQMSPSNNCMNKWLGEPVLGNFMKNLVINNFQNQCIETLM